MVSPSEDLQTDEVYLAGRRMEDGLWEHEGVSLRESLSICSSSFKERGYLIIHYAVYFQRLILRCI